MPSKYTRRGYTGRNAKTDANQKEIVKALEQIPGVEVAEIGKPLDLLIGYAGITHIVEIKNPNGKDRINKDQAEFIENWPGRRPEVARSLDEVLRIIGVTQSSLAVTRRPV